MILDRVKWHYERNVKIQGFYWHNVN